MGKVRMTANLGVYVYGGSAMALGILGLASRDFATNWQRVAADAPHRTALALAAAVCELLFGAAMLARPTARAGALLLALFYMVFTASWVVRAAAAPGTWDSWGNVFEEFSLVSAGLVLFAWLAPTDSAWARKTGAITRLYGICVVSFGLTHFTYLSGAATWVPRWIPPGQTFWVLATGTFFMMAAAAILSGILAALASRLLTAMIVGFELLVWVPKLAAAPHDHFAWAGNAICVALAGAAWVVSDALSASASRADETVTAWPGAVSVHPLSSPEINRPT